MRNNSLFFRTLLTAGVVISLGAVAFAQTPGAGPTGKDGKKTGKKGNAGLRLRLNDLNLTDTQKAKVKDIMKEAGEKRKALKDKTGLTEDQKKEQGREIAKDTMKSIQAILTPEQKKKLEEAMAKAREEAKKGAKKPGATKPAAAPKGI